jgi:dynein intermediate chain
MHYPILNSHILVYILQSGFVSAASDGTVNFWSPANLMEPAETLVVPGVNISSLAVAPGSETLLVGDESGSMHAILPSTSSSSKRTIVKLNSDAKDGIDSSGHYGNVTGLSTKPPLKKDSSVGISKGFARGAHGLVLSSGVDWQTILWAPAYTDKPLLNFLSHSYDYMSDAKWYVTSQAIFFYTIILLMNNFVLIFSETGVQFIPQYLRLHQVMAL